MLLLGLICLILGIAAGIAVLVTVGWILVIAGAIMLVFGSAGRPVGGRTWWW